MSVAAGVTGRLLSSRRLLNHFGMLLDVFVSAANKHFLIKMLVRHISYC